MKHFTHNSARIVATVAVVLALTTQAFALEVPVSQTEQMVNGQQMLIKVFETTPETDPQTLIEENIQQNGYVYTMTSIVKDTITKEDDKEITQIETITIDSSDEDDARVEALKSLPPFIEYDTDGYTGKLYPLVNTLELSETGRTSHSGSNKITRTYTYEYNDDSLIPASVTEGGKTYNKASVTWSEGSYMENSTIPENYVATVTYTRPYSYTTINGFTASMTYSGTVEIEYDDIIQYTLTYYGTPVEEYEKQQKEKELNDGNTVSDMPEATPFIIGGGVLAAAAVAGGVIYNVTKKRRA